MMSVPVMNFSNILSYQRLLWQGIHMRFEGQFIIFRGGGAHPQKAHFYLQKPSKGPKKGHFRALGTNYEFQLDYNSGFLIQLERS